MSPLLLKVIYLVRVYQCIKRNAHEIQPTENIQSEMDLTMAVAGVRRSGAENLKVTTKVM